MKTFFLGVFLLFIGSGAAAQATKASVAKTALTNTKSFILTNPLDRLSKDLKTPQQSPLKQRMVFDAQKLPIFCKIEHKLAKSSKVNVMMRLGSLDYVNKLEGKQ